MEIEGRSLLPLARMRQLFKRQDHQFDTAAYVVDVDKQASAFPEWDAVRERLADRWPILTADELDATHGRAELVAALLQAKLVYAQRLAEESVGHSLGLVGARPPTDGRGWRNMSVIGLSALTTFGLFSGLVLFL